MIDADCSGIAHRGCHHSRERRVVARRDAAWLESRQMPVLAILCEGVRRAADRRTAEIDVRLAPCGRSVQRFTHCEVEIEAYTQALGPGMSHNLQHLLMSDPLQPDMKLYVFLEIIGKGRDGGCMSVLI